MDGLCFNFGPVRTAPGPVFAMVRRGRATTHESARTRPRDARRRVPPSPRSSEISQSRVFRNAGRQGQQVAHHPPALIRGLALLEGEHPLEGSWFTGADREHDFEICKSEGRLVVRARRPVVERRLRRASSPGMMEVGGFFVDFGPVRTASERERARSPRRRRRVSRRAGRTSPTTIGKGSSAARPWTRRFVKRIWDG